MRPAPLLLSPPSCWHYVPSSRCAAAQVPPFLAPLSSPASCSSTHTHNTQVPASSMPPPTARATIPRLVRALFAVSASPSTPAAGTQCAAARSPSALEGPVTRATYSYQLLLCPGRTARTPLRIAARALLALRSVTVRHMLPPPFYSSNVSRPRAPSHNKHLVVFFVFVFLDVLAAHAVHDELIAASRASASCDLSMRGCCTEKCSADLHMFASKEQNLNFVIFFLGVMLQLCHN